MSTEQLNNQKYDSDYIEAYYEAEHNTNILKEQINNDLAKKSKQSHLDLLEFEEQSDTADYIDVTKHVEFDIAKKKKGRPKKYDDVKQAYNDNKYYTQYYRDHKHIKVECPYCKKQVIKYIIRKHQNSKKCQIMRIKNENENKINDKYENLRTLLINALELHK